MHYTVYDFEARHTYMYILMEWDIEFSFLFYSVLFVNPEIAILKPSFFCSVRDGGPALSRCAPLLS